MATRILLRGQRHTWEPTDVLMRVLGTWLTEVDGDILDFFSEHRIDVPPKVLYHNSRTEARYNSVKRRMRKLEAAGILEKLEEPTGYYRITPLGEKILNSELSREEIRELEPD